MPTYEYLCESCGHKFEDFQSIKARPLRKCPACGKLKLKRLIGTGAGIIFKGSGFYATDHRSPSGQTSAKKAEKAEKAEAAASSDKPEAKPTSTDSKSS